MIAILASPPHKCHYTYTFKTTLPNNFIKSTCLDVEKVERSVHLYFSLSDWIVKLGVIRDSERVELNAIVRFFVITSRVNDSL